MLGKASGGKEKKSIFLLFTGATSEKKGSISRNVTGEGFSILAGGGREKFFSF